MKYTFAVAMLLAGAEAHRHHHHHVRRPQNLVQFVDFVDDEDVMTKESIAAAEKLHGTEFKPFTTGDQTYKQSLAENNKLSFNTDGEGSFAQVFKIKDSMEAPAAAPVGVTMLQSGSDPIWGSLGVPKIDAQDLTPEQQFEQSQRNMKAPEVKDSEEVITTNNSIKKAEEIVKSKMPSPTSKEEIERMKNAASTQVEYHLHTADEEDPETVETRRSVKTVEQRMKHRFFINAREKRDYDKLVAEGKISPAEVEFKEGEDEDIGAKKEDETKKAEEEKKVVGEQQEKAKADADKAAGGDKKEGGDAKKEGGDAKKEEKKEGDAKKEEAFVPPELAGGPDAAPAK